jgi:carboxyl-terminal processing protease
MRRFSWGFGILVLLFFVVPAAEARPEQGDTRKAKAYLREVRKHLLESYIDGKSLSEERLVGAALKAMAAAMRTPDFQSLEPEARDAVRSAIRDAETMDAAIDLVAERAPGVNLILLADHAARAMIRVTGDPFSRLLTDEDMKKLMKMMSGEGAEDSAGMALQLEGNHATVMYVQYGTAAYEDGIEMGDDVREVRGRKVDSIRPEELPDLLRLPPGDTLELKVHRFDKDYVFRIAPRKAPIKDVRYQNLGQGVGYLRMTIFDLSLLREVKAALKEMAKGGMRGLILDLRHNPGGALPSATGVADQFLPQGLIIAKTYSHYKPSFGGLSLPGLGGDAEYTTKVATPWEEMPMVCLIDGASASASELLAGALQDHKRAVMIGEKTYGKGIGQTAIPLSSMMMRRFLYLTVMRYTTPLGHEVNHVGISPDIACPEDRYDAATFDAAWTLRRSGALEAYLDAHPGKALLGLAESDRFEPERYPRFDDLYKKAGAGLSRDVVRAELRRALRRRIEEEDNTLFVCDLESDRVLQRGLVEVLDRLEKEK